ncbi:SPW repeat protein [Roseomonas chloroacetimidivorans]|uniref:SPW repeat protein n=1 Tax=Roseomonas chloroacetimidivorans TaxID=1766656 RepID=UPI003C71A928
MRTLMRSTKPVEIVNLVAAICLFLAPWVLGFSNAWPADWNAWLTGAMLAVHALWARRSSGEWTAWTEGGEAILGIWAICSPWIGHFTANQPAMWSHVIIGAIVVVVTALGLIWPRMHGIRIAKALATKRLAMLLAGLVCLGTATAHAAMTDAHNANLGHGADFAFAEALNALAADGWRHVTDLRREGDFVRATAEDFGGHRRAVLVDPRTGVVLPDFETVRDD